MASFDEFKRANEQYAAGFEGETFRYRRRARSLW